MSKDRKAKNRALGPAIGVSVAVITGVVTALALSLSGGAAPPAQDQHDVIYPSDVHSDAEITEPPAP